MNKERYTKKDFYVGQKVYTEYVGLKLSLRGKVRIEIVTKVGNKYVETDHQMKYYIKDGEQATEYSREYLLWVDVKEYELKLKKDKVYRDLAKKFNSGYGDIEEQELYKKLTLEDLQEIGRIIDKAMKE
jgi:hypothetical protein